ncbi:MAG: YfiR family protein [Fibrobacteres bacterium]|nr:YfiR family protein [Fibrobacterota bacterium]
MKLPDKEYQVKAGFLFNFTQFVEWPAESFPAKDSPLVVGILGPDPFGDYLDEMVKGETVGSHPIKVLRFHRIEDVKDCQILFISGPEAQRPENVFAALKERRILTVGDSEDFSKRGGMVGFVTKNGKIRLQINTESVQAADLTVSSKLLRLADIVSTGKG